MSSSPAETLAVRPATVEDAARVVELIVATDTAVEGWSDQTPDELLDWWRRNDPAANTWLVEDGDVIVYGDYFEHADRAELDGYVHPDRKGEGLGSWLVAQAEERARAAGKRRLQTWCLGSDDDARQLFEGRGFVPVRRFYRM